MSDNIDIIVQDTINDIVVNSSTIVETIDISVEASVEEVTIISNPNDYIININKVIGEQVQSDWDVTIPEDPAYIKNKPTIPAAQVNSDWNATTGVAQILNKPTIPTQVTNTSELINDGADGVNPFITAQDIPAGQVNSDWNATSGVAEILNKPTIPAEQVNSDWNATSGKAEILNKPTIPSISGLATITYVDQQDALKVDKVAGKGLSTNDFTNTLKTKLDGIQDGAEVNVNADWNAVSGDAQILNKPTIPSISGLATITYVDQQDALKVDKVTGYGLSQNDFTNTLKTKLDGIQDGAEVNVNADWNAVSGDAQILNKPTIPAAQVNSDWNATSGVAQILNKPTIPSVNGFVPYTGATSDVDLGTYNLTADHIALNVSASGAGFVEGATKWNNSIGSSETLLKGGNVSLKNGIDLVARVVNKVVPNSTLTKAQYQVVRVSGAQGQRLAVDLAQANNDNNSADTLGIVIETITTNQEGFIMTVGQIEDINTSGSLQGETWVDGDVLYLSPTTAGNITNIKPNGSNGHIVIIGYVEYAHSSKGKIYVKIMNGWELDELHNVFISSPINNQLLSYESSTELWINKSVTTADIADSTDKRYVTDANLTTIGNQSGTNTGDNATNSQYSGLATSKQDTLVSGTNIKTINGNSVLGSGDLTISGGSGLRGIHALIPLSSGNFTSSQIQASSSASASAFTSNRLIAYPFIPAQNITTSNLFINVQTLAAGSLCRIAIYDDLNGYPNNRLFLSSDLDCSTTGNKTATTSFSFVSGVVYWLAFHGNSQTTNAGIVNFGVTQLLPIRNTSATAAANHIFVSSTFTLGTPTTFPTASPSFSAGNIPAIIITKA